VAELVGEDAETSAGKSRRVHGDVVDERAERAARLAEDVPDDEDRDRGSRARDPAALPVSAEELPAGAEVGPVRALGAGRIERAARRGHLERPDERLRGGEELDCEHLAEHAPGLGEARLDVLVLRHGPSLLVAEDDDPDPELLRPSRAGEAPRQLRDPDDAVARLAEDVEPLGEARREQERRHGARLREGYTSCMAQAPALPSGFELPLEPRLPRIGSVDQVAVEERAATLATRSIKRESKLFALDLAVRMIDLTTLEGADTPGKVAALSSKAMRPDPADLTVPPVAAVCVYPNLVPHALKRVRGSGVKVASVATAFPSGQVPTELKVEEAARVAELGTDEIDMVIDRGAFLSGHYAKVYDEVRRVKEVCGDAHLKVILETGELGTYDNVRRASLIAIAGGADFVKTSTGKIQPAATLPVTLVMLEVIRDVYEETGKKIGMKPAGGIRHAKQAVQYLVLLHETLGPEWLTPDLFRFGASSLLNDVLMQIRKERTGRYQSPDYFTID
jgi:deoxyribose-phosphate aldolase